MALRSYTVPYTVFTGSINIFLVSGQIRCWGVNCGTGSTNFFKSNNVEKKHHVNVKHQTPTIKKVISTTYLHISQLIYFLHVIQWASCCFLRLSLGFSFIRLTARQEFLCQNASKDKHSHAKSNRWYFSARLCDSRNTFANLSIRKAVKFCKIAMCVCVCVTCPADHQAQGW